MSPRRSSSGRDGTEERAYGNGAALTGGRARVRTRAEWTKTVDAAGGGPSQRGTRMDGGAQAAWPPTPPHPPRSPRLTPQERQQARGVPL